MQSFMAMEVVAFNNSDTSNAYVATSQIYLQGSDFDIDKASLLGSIIRNGKYGEFTACSNYPKCKYIKQEEKQITEICNCPKWGVTCKNAGKSTNNRHYEQHLQI